MPSVPLFSGAHLYSAHAAFGGYKQSGIGCETHKMMLDHYRLSKNMLVCLVKLSVARCLASSRVAHSDDSENMASQGTLCAEERSELGHLPVAKRSVASAELRSAAAV